MVEPPQFPAGPNEPREDYDDAQKLELIEQVASIPRNLRNAVLELNDEQLDTRYRNWTIRQIVHHLADSHLNTYIRFKWTLTEDTPLIKAYDETAWSALLDARTMKLEPSLIMLDGIHKRWTAVLLGMTDLQFQRTFKHPETGDVVSLRLALPSYAWHGRHHTAQIEWLRKTHNW